MYRPYDSPLVDYGTRKPSLDVAPTALRTV